MTRIPAVGIPGGGYLETARDAAPETAVCRARPLAYDADVLMEIRFQPSGRTVCVARGTTLLEAARAAGLPAARACGGDLLCGRCACRLLRGAERHGESADETRTKARNRIGTDRRLSCAVRIEGDLEVTAPGW